MKEKSESEPSSSPSSVPGSSNPPPSSGPGPSIPGDQIIKTISEQEFYELVNSLENILVTKFTQNKEENAK